MLLRNLFLLSNRLALRSRLFSPSISLQSSMRIKQTTAVYSTQQIDKYRTHYCGKMSLANEGEVVQLSGWVQSVRTNNFILLRDLHGLVQIFIDDELLKKDDNLAKLKSLSEESVVSVHGLVRRRPKGQENPRMPTGAVEVLCERFELVNKSQTQLPFNISEHNRPNETLRLKYRYLDLRMPEMQHNLILRSKFVHRVRQFMNENGFLDIETPTLFRRTPGGAREFIVPTKEPGQFYCLTQSPQQFKQLLMIAGLDRYYQVARCYRDESTRVDRQPEFTQIDIEMSFITDQDLMRLVEDLLDKCWPPELASTRPSLPINRMKYKDAMDQYGVDKPDVRFDMRMNDVTELFAADAGGAKSTGVNRIDASLKASGSFFATAIRIPKSYNTSSVTLNEIEKTYIQIFEVTHFSEAQVESKKGFTFLAFKNKSGTGVAKHLNSELRDQLIQRVGAEADDIVLVLVSNNKAKSQEIFGKVRLAVADLIDEKSIKKAAVVADAKKITPTAVKLIRDPKDFKFLWVVEFPLFNRNEDTNEFESCHHPFTAPIDAHLDLVREKRDLDSVIGLHYDLVLNGCEIAGGSIRVHSAALQRHILEGILGESVEQLAHLIEALEYGAPPHGGIAFGLDRLVAMMCNTSNIRNVIAFPKSHSGRDLMSSAPSAVAQEELDYYKIRCVKE